MSETFFELVATYGVWIVGLSSFFSCLLVPIPTALVMLAGGAFAASGDLSLVAVLGAAYAGAVLGDQTGYRIGRAFGPRLISLAETRPKARESFAKARQMVAEKGGPAVFITTWLLAPLGPWVNIAAGAGGLRPLIFTLWDAAGEAIWVSFYVLMGYFFASDILSLADILTDAAGFVVAAALTFGLGLVLVRRLRARQIA